MLMKYDTARTDKRIHDYNRAQHVKDWFYDAADYFGMSWDWREVMPIIRDHRLIEWAIGAIVGINVALLALNYFGV